MAARILDSILEAATETSLPPIETLVEGLLRGEKLALARLITLIERESPDASRALSLALSGAEERAGRSYCVGFTGPPGSGKSTLVDGLTTNIRGGEGDATVGIVAVDPSSPFTGGALLGDRIRMEGHYKDPGVYIRSMGTRGGRGGVPSVAQRVASLLAASGKDYVIVETVGVGQTELDVMETADTVVVVLVPEAGDTIQTMKAGLMEIADVFVVNKADRGGAEKLASNIEQSLTLIYEESYWRAPVLLTEANAGVGVAELREAIEGHRKAAAESGELERRRRRRRRAQFVKSVEEKITGAFHAMLDDTPMLQDLLREVEEGARDPYTAASEALRDRGVRDRWLSLSDD